MTVLVGTSGWQYAHWRGRFYPPGMSQAGWLDWYVERFDTVELNVTFYRLPKPAVFEAWGRRVPDGFVFAVKASRYITHVRRLRDPVPSVERLMEAVARLGDHLGPILVQLPPDMRAEPDRLDRTLAAFPAAVRVAVEPRHASWWTDEVRDVLRRRGAALAWADRRGAITPAWATATWGYVRLHEGRASPQPCYGERALRTWADRVTRAFSPDEVVHVYFNNDPLGCAVRDAAAFARIADRLGHLVGRAPDRHEVRVG